MATITEDYCSFELSKLLKEKGFPQKQENSGYYATEMVYCTKAGKDGSHHFCHQYPACMDKKNEYICAPALSLACKWLREVHGLHISLEPCYDYDSMHVVFLAFVQNVADVHDFMDGRKNVASHPNAEKSCELAIKYCLEHLI